MGFPYGKGGTGSSCRYGHGGTKPPDGYCKNCGRPIYYNTTDGMCSYNCRREYKEKKVETKCQ